MGEKLRRAIYSLSDLANHKNGFADVPRARSHIDVQAGDSKLVVSGWLISLDQPSDHLYVFYDGALMAEPELADHGLSAAMPWIPHAARCSFVCEFPLKPAQMCATGRLDVIATHASQRIGGFSSLVRPDLETSFPAPPGVYAERVIGSNNLRHFRLGGIWMFTQFCDALNRHSDIAGVKTLLDWGCGSGRVSAHFLAINGGPAISGCDIDGDAIRWCNGNLKANAFTRVDSLPPTPYRNAQFDVVIAMSVLTHLTAEVQNLWLTELRRIIAPGGIIVISVIGEFAAKWLFRTKHPTMPSTGIDSSVVDHALDGVVPSGYYRLTIQTRDYTLRQYSKYFDVLEYREAGMGNYHDMVIMRRR